MTKLLSPLRACLMLAGLSALGGCELYFGNDSGSDDRWTYCASDGYYVCAGEYCEWAGPQCPDEPGYTCTSDADCAAGCYCGDTGVCEEAGFCNEDAQCPDGYTCDEERSSCVPEACDADTDCAAGEYCDAEAGACVSSCSCTTDAEAQAAGWANCDEARATCNPVPEAGSCQGASTCNIVEPTCAAGQVPLVADGCFTGQCGEIAACDLTPECEKLQASGDCAARAGACTSVFVGINCTSPTGTACDAGTSDCTCTSFQFADCRTPTSNLAAPFVYEVNGQLVDMFSTH